MKLVHVIWIFSYQNPSIKKNAWKNWSLFSQVTAHVCISCNSCACSLCVSCVIPMHATYAHLVQFSCMQPVCILCIITLHPRRSRTPMIFLPMTRTMILALQSVGFGKEGATPLSLEVKNNSHQKSLGNPNL